MFQSKGMNSHNLFQENSEALILMPFPQNLLLKLTVKTEKCQP